MPGSRFTLDHPALSPNLICLSIRMPSGVLLMGLADLLQLLVHVDEEQPVGDSSTGVGGSYSKRSLPGRSMNTSPRATLPSLDDWMNRDCTVVRLFR